MFGAQGVHPLSEDGTPVTRIEQDEMIVNGTLNATYMHVTQRNCNEFLPSAMYVCDEMCTAAPRL